MKEEIKQVAQQLAYLTEQVASLVNNNPVKNGSVFAAQISKPSKYFFEYGELPRYVVMYTVNTTPVNFRLWCGYHLSNDSNANYVCWTDTTSVTANIYQLVKGAYTYQQSLRLSDYIDQQRNLRMVKVVEDTPNVKG